MLILNNLVNPVQQLAGATSVRNSRIRIPFGCRLFSRLW